MGCSRPSVSPGSVILEEGLIDYMPWILHLWCGEKIILKPYRERKLTVPFYSVTDQLHYQHTLLTWNVFKGHEESIAFHFPPVPFSQTHLQPSLMVLCLRQRAESGNTCSHSPLKWKEGCGVWAAIQKCTRRKKGGKPGASYWNSLGSGNKYHLAMLSRMEIALLQRFSVSYVDNLFLFIKSHHHVLLT